MRRPPELLRGGEHGDDCTRPRPEPDGKLELRGRPLWPPQRPPELPLRVLEVGSESVAPPDERERERMSFSAASLCSSSRLRSGAAALRPDRPCTAHPAVGTCAHDARSFSNALPSSCECLPAAAPQEQHRQAWVVRFR